ncbi:MAG: FMN-binding glutamate synthase family protein [Bacillota bacterium]|nr:FMN-binding glutamate synthase family protein [Bacillota bacterium]
MSSTKSKLLAGAAGVAGGLVALRFLASQIVRQSTKVLMTDPYVENLSELLSATKRTGVQTILETNLRAQKAQVLQRPLGSPRRFMDFDGLMFVSAHLDRQPLPHTTAVNTETTIGPKSKKPLTVSTPLLVSGMAYRKALSDRTKYALALGSRLAGTASNTGEGPFLPKERELAERLIIQYPRIPLHRTVEILAQADALEIQLGQGASAGGAQAPYPHLVLPELPPLRKSEDLPKIVRFLKQVGGGVPVGVKFSFTANLEREIDLCLDAEVDFLALEGANAATAAAPPILEDDFGLPTIMGLCRAVEHLKTRGVHNQVSLIVSGGFFSPGQCLKALALGANAIYLGTMPLYALSHTQTTKSIPWEPPSQLVVHGGKQSGRLNWKLAARHLANYLISCTEEIKEGVRALGKRALHEVDASDLVSLDEMTSQVTGTPLVYPRRTVRALVPSKG